MIQHHADADTAVEIIANTHATLSAHPDCNYQSLSQESPRGESAEWQHSSHLSSPTSTMQNTPLTPNLKGKQPAGQTDMQSQPYFAPPPGSNTGTQRTPAEKVAFIKRWQSRQRYLGLILSCTSLGLATIMDGILAYVLHKFYTTRNIPAPGRTGPWAKQTQLWPTFMLLAGSGLTFIIDAATLFAACCAWSRRMNLTESWLGTAGKIAFVAKWFVIAVLYRTGKTSRDLWGWACDVRAANIQQFYQDDLNFGTLCHAQTAAWCMSLTEMVVKFGLLGFVLWLEWRIKRMDKEEEEEKEIQRIIRRSTMKLEEKGVASNQEVRPSSRVWTSLVDAARMVDGPRK